MTPTQLLAHFRNQAFDTATPQLWLDAEAYTYMDNAQNEFVRITGGIRDNSTSSICDITVTANVNSVATSPKILKIALAKNTTLGKIPVINHTDYRAEAIEAAGTLSYLVQGEGENVLRPISVPTVNTAVHLTVMRLPLLAPGGSNPFEIRDEYTAYLVYSMLEQAYLKDDPDTYNKTRSETHGATFRAHAERCKTELERRNYTAGQMAYGGI